jgi:hypothetical protein
MVWHLARAARIRLDPTSRAALNRFLSQPRYEVLPTDEAEELVANHVPPDVTITITSSPKRGIDATILLAERLGRRGYTVIPHLARLVRTRRTQGDRRQASARRQRLRRRRRLARSRGGSRIRSRC